MDARGGGWVGVLSTVSALGVFAALGSPTEMRMMAAVMLVGVLMAVPGLLRRRWSSEARVEPERRR